jgi:hypothetical protein
MHDDSIHTFAEDTLGMCSVFGSEMREHALIERLDEDDFIVPRTVTRLGPKYQAVVPARMAAGPITHRELSFYHEFELYD